PRTPSRPPSRCLASVDWASWPADVLPERVVSYQLSVASEEVRPFRWQLATIRWQLPRLVNQDRPQSSHDPRQIALGTEDGTHVLVRRRRFIAKHGGAILSEPHVLQLAPKVAFGNS